MQHSSPSSVRLGSLAFFLSLVLCSLFGVVTPAFANAPSPPAPSAQPVEKLPWVAGPKHLSLPHGIEFDVPKDHLFLAQPHAGKLLEKQGNLHNDDLLGIVIPDESETESRSDEDSWLVTIRFEEEGFIKDDETPNPKEILETIREGEPDYNEERKKLGFSPIHAEGWKEEPRYNSKTHELEWALIVSTTEGKTVNLNTRILGRKGFAAVNFLVDPDALDRHRDEARAVRAAVTFGEGHRYEDFDAKKDKVAEYGLTGLVLGGAGFGLLKAAKLGLLAKFGKLLITGLLVAKKGVVFLLAGIAALFKKIFGSREPTREAVLKDESQAPESTVTPE